MFKLGLTGGIGSGKSTIANLLHKLGAALIDADAISRQCTQARGAAIEHIRLAFGTRMLTPEGALDREAMRQLIYKTPDAKTRLEAIIHPIVGREISLLLLAALDQKKRLTVLDIPLLAEGGSRWRHQLDAVWVVDCLPDTQIQRVTRRSGWQPEQIQSVMNLQTNRVQRLACADAVIYNEDLSLTDLEAMVKQITKPLL